jgi:hypothetical protein
MPRTGDASAEGESLGASHGHGQLRRAGTAPIVLLVDSAGDLATPRVPDRLHPHEYNTCPRC